MRAPIATGNKLRMTSQDVSPSLLFGKVRRSINLACSFAVPMYSASDFAIICSVQPPLSLTCGPLDYRKGSSARFEVLKLRHAAAVVSATLLLLLSRSLLSSSQDRQQRGRALRRASQIELEAPLADHALCRAHPSQHRTFLNNH